MGLGLAPLIPRQVSESREGRGEWWEERKGSEGSGGVVEDRGRGRKERSVEGIRL